MRAKKILKWPKSSNKVAMCVTAEIIKLTKFKLLREVMLHMQYYMPSPLTFSISYSSFSGTVAGFFAVF